MHANLPMQVAQLVANPDWKGGPLLILEGECVRPSASTVAKNYPWLLPMVRDSPQRVGEQRCYSEIVYLDYVFIMEGFKFRGTFGLLLGRRLPLLGRAHA